MNRNYVYVHRVTVELLFQFKIKALVLEDENLNVIVLSWSSHIAAIDIFLPQTKSEISKVYREEFMAPVEFFPKGAIAFFISLLIFFSAIWFFLYWLMVQRS